MKDLGVIIIGVVSVAIAAIIIVFAGKSDTQTTASGELEYNTANPPVLEMSDQAFYLKPNIKIQQKDIKLGNSGKSEMVLTGFQSSSNVISAVVINNKKESPVFDTDSSSWKTTLNPNATAILRIKFDQKKINRSTPPDCDISFKTNDPNNKSVRIVFSSTPINEEINDPKVDETQPEKDPSTEQYDELMQRLAD